MPEPDLVTPPEPEIRLVIAPAVPLPDKVRSWPPLAIAPESVSEPLLVKVWAEASVRAAAIVFAPELAVLSMPLEPRVRVKLPESVVVPVPVNASPAMLRSAVRVGWKEEVVPNDAMFAVVSLAGAVLPVQLEPVEKNRADVGPGEGGLGVERGERNAGDARQRDECEKTCGNRGPRDERVG